MQELVKSGNTPMLFPYEPAEYWHTDQLNFYDKLRRLKHQAALNENVKANSVHISLNFDGADRLDKQKLVTIADSYMKQIGFASQPYLVYHRIPSVATSRDSC